MASSRANIRRCENVYAEADFDTPPMRACAVMLVGGVLNPRCLREINVFVARLVLIVVGVTTRIFFAAIWANSRRCVSIWRGRAPRGNGWRMSEACSGDVLLGPGVDPRNGEPPAVYQARAGGGLFGVWPSALDQHRWTRQHHTRCTGRGFGVWSASRYLHRAGCGFMQSACSIIGGVVDLAGSLVDLAGSRQLLPVERST